MLSPISSQAIAPATLLRGQGAWDEALPRLPQLCQRPFLLGRSMATQTLRDQLSGDLEALGLCEFSKQHSKFAPPAVHTCDLAPRLLREDAVHGVGPSERLIWASDCVTHDIIDCVDGGGRRSEQGSTAV